MAKAPCYCMSLRKVTRRITARYDAALAPHGITLAQHGMLRAVERNGRVSLTVLGGMLDLDRSTVGRNVRPLIKAGLLEAAESDDGRESAVMLTDRGQAVMDAAQPDWSAAQKQVEGVLGKKKLAKLIAALDTI